jgi:hypothetical protein
MKAIFDKIGYTLVVFGFFCILYKNGNYLLFETSFLLNGSVENLEVTSKEKVNDENIYYFKLNNTAQNIYKSLPTQKEYLENDKVKVRTIPMFKKVFIGEFVLGSYIIGIALVLFGLAVAALSFCMIFNIENKYTTRIKQANL